MLVHWARTEGWLVLYVPKGREWTHGGLFYKNPHTDLWDTPVQAAKALQVMKVLDHFVFEVFPSINLQHFTPLAHWP